MLIFVMDGSCSWSNQLNQLGTLMPSGAVHTIMRGLDPRILQKHQFKAMDCRVNPRRLWRLARA
jgi:hypothetical protein